MNIDIRRRLAGVAAAAIAAAALSATGASPAAAVLPGHCLGAASIQGHGTESQTLAQAIWASNFPINIAGGGCASKSATYARTDAGACLDGIGATGGPVNTTRTFCGTDIPPNANQIATATATAGAALLTLPVAQTAVAIVVNPPAGCTVTTITPAQLETAFRGSLTSWTGVGGTGTCEAAITPVVPSERSGTGYQLKHYLTTRNAAPVHAGASWGLLQSSGYLTTWPGTPTRSQSGCATAMSLPCAGGAGSGSNETDEVRTVGVTAGSIGFASLPVARAQYAAFGTTWPNLKWIPVRPGIANINPSTNGLSTTKANANCPTSNASYGTLPSATGDWSAVYLISPGSAYPICTLTWDLALANYAPKFGAGSANIAQTTKDYLQYILRGGQADALSSANDYQVLPHDMTTAATTGTGEISG